MEAKIGKKPLPEEHGFCRKNKNILKFGKIYQTIKSLEQKDTAVKTVHTEKFKVEWADACASGHLSLPGMLNFIQVVAGNHANELGIGYYHMAAAGQAWVLNRLKARFTRMPRWTEEIEASTWIESFNDVISERNILITHKGQTIAQISTVWVCINYEKRAPEAIAVPYPPGVVLPEKKLDIKTASRVRMPQDARLLRTYRVSFSDIDAMGHVNNIKYTQWIVDSLPYEAAVGITSGEIEANFLAELHYGDTVDIESAKSGEGFTFAVRRQGCEKPAFISHFNPL